MHPLVSLEDHFLSPTLDDEPSVQKTSAEFPPHLLEKLRDIGPLRQEDIKAGGLSLQVLSHFPYDGSAERCRAVNDDLAARLTTPTRQSNLAAFATLPMRDPPAAAIELRRCVKELGFVGCLIDNHLEDGTFYDGERFWPVFAEAEALDVPVYLHPTFPSEEQHRRHAGNYDSTAQFMMGIAGWAWHAETGLHVIRLFAAGVFDKFPRLKLVIGHMGELLPFQLERIIAVASRGVFGKRTRSFGEVWQENIWITTSGMFSVNPLACVLRNTNKQHIMYSVDYPFSSNVTGLAFMEELGKSGLVTDEELAMIAHQNAEALLKVKAPA